VQLARHDLQVFVQCSCVFCLSGHALKGHSAHDEIPPEIKAFAFTGVSCDWEKRENSGDERKTEEESYTDVFRVSGLDQGALVYAGSTTGALPGKTGS
jgi:hypothetical protein